MDLGDPAMRNKVERDMSKRMCVLWILGWMGFLLSLPACGPGNGPVVEVRIYGNGSDEETDQPPCLGAARLAVRIEMPNQTVYGFDIYGQYFVESDFSCTLSSYNFPNLPLSNEVSIKVNVYDSTIDNTKGFLSTGSSTSISVQKGSPKQTVDVELFRRDNGVPTTVAVMNPPSDWNSVQNIYELSFTLEQWDANLNPILTIRSGKIAYGAKVHSNPFPLFISNADMAEDVEHHLKITAKAQGGAILHVWEGSVWKIEPTARLIPVTLSTFSGS
jgi:hypothetical protein